MIPCPSEIDILNSEGFALERQGLYIDFPTGTLVASVTVYDAVGRLFFSHAQEGPTPFVFQAEELAPGTYVVSVITNSDKRVEKVVKLR